MARKNGIQKSATPAVFPTGGRPDGEPDANGGVPRLADEGTDDLEGGPKFEGFESENAFLQHWAKTYRDDLDADKHNLDEAKEDLRFTYVDQWDPAVRAERERQGRPCITINTLPQFVGQVIGDRRINQTSVKVLPSTNGTVKEAEVRTGMIRSIENFSRAKRVYDACCEDQVVAGISNFEITMEYSYNDVFVQDIFVRQLDNPFAVIWDRFSKDPTGRDARHCFVEETMDRKAFEKEYPDVAIPTATLGEYTFGEENSERDDVKIIALWMMKEKPAKFALMRDGSVEDVTGEPDIAWMHRAYQEIGADGVPELYVREGRRLYARRYLITTYAVLEGPYDLPISRLPIIKVSGRVGRVGVKQYRFGLIRWTRDPSLMRNYWRSIAVETLAMAPKAQWIADHASVKGREQDFRDAHMSGDPLLVYNTAKNAPKRVDPPQLPGAVLNEAAMNTQDIKDVTGLHDASLGVRSNEVSGKAIMARQREGDIATIVFHDNLNLSIEEGGSVINELFPVCYDTVRMARVMGVDDQITFVRINDPNDDNPNITNAKYDVQIVTGPSYTTQRQEGAELLLETMKVNPALFEVAGDILMETQDIPGGQRIADRLKKVLPAAQQEEAARQQEEGQGQPQEPTQEQQMAAAAMQMQMELAQAQHAAQMAAAQAELAEAQARVQQANAKAAEAEARARKAQMELEISEEDIRKTRANAEEAEANAVIAEEDIDRERERHEAEQQQRHDAHVVSIHQKMNPPERSGGSNSRAAASAS